MATGVHCYMLITILMFILSLVFWANWSQRGTFLYVYYCFNVYLFKIIFIYICLGKFGPKMWSSPNKLKFDTGVCVFIFFHREGFFRLQDVCNILDGPDQRSCVVNIILGASAKFIYLGIWKCHISPPKTRTLAKHKTGEKTIWYIGGQPKDDIYWHRI